MSNEEQSEKYIELCAAIKRGDGSVARQLILNNAKVNLSCKSFLNTPLHWAVIKFQDTELIEILLDKKSNVHSKNYRHQTPLNIAVQLGKVDAVKLFLNNGAYGINNFKSLIYTATTKKFEKIVKLLVDYCATNHPSINLKNSLDVAAGKGFSKILQYIIPYCKFKKSSKKLIPHGAICGKGQEYEDCVSLLLQHGFTISLSVIKNDFFVHEIVKNGHVNIVEILLKLGINVNMISEKTGLALLHVACLYRHLKTVEVLVKYQATVNLIIDEKKCFQKDIFSPKQTTKLDGKTCLYIAVDNLDVAMTKLLLNNGANLNKDPNFHAIINLAMRKKEIFEELLEHIADINAVNDQEETLLHLCASCEHFHTFGDYNLQLEIIQLLLRKGANINAQSYEGNTPLFDAVKHEYYEMAKWLLENNADAQHRNKFGNGLLHVAAEEIDDSEFFETLLEYTTDINATNNDGSTPLHMAFNNVHYGIVDFLLDHNVKVNLADKDGKTTLILACKRQSPIAIDLLEKKADPNIKDKFSTTALHYACEYAGDDFAQDIVEFLLENNADINALNARGQTPLFNACNSEYLPVINLLLDNNADINHVDSKGTTPIWFAATDKWNRVKVMKLLLERKANFHFSNSGKRPLIHLVAEKNHLDVIESLVKLNVNFNSVDKKGCTALHLATEKGHLEMVKSLLKHGANINIVNKNRQTAVRYAATHLNELRVEFIDFRENHNDDYYSNITNSDDSSDDYVGRMNSYRNSIFAYEEIVNIFEEHIVKLKCANLRVNTQNLDIVNKEIEDSESDSNDDDDDEVVDEVNPPTLENNCESEIEQMRMNIGNSNVTFNDLLTKSIHFLSGYAKNESIRQTLELDIYNTKFPLYINILKSRLAEALLRRRLLIPARKYFDSNIITSLPPNCVDKVLSFLNTKDLKMFIRAVRPTKK